MSKAPSGRRLDLGAIGYDAVKHLVLCRVERRPPRLDLDIYPYLPRARVETTKPVTGHDIEGHAVIVPVRGATIIEWNPQIPTFLCRLCCHR